MKLNSPLFDSIRVKPSEDRRVKPNAPCCQWKGCSNAATHRAPKGRDNENEHWRFCLDHVREYNNSYNYFKGMSADDVSRYQKDALTGHRPTWKMGTGNTPGGSAELNATDPLNLFHEFNSGAGWRRRAEQAAPKRTIRNAERKAFETLGLEVSAGSVEIKSRFKELVKRHHPDANGGDRVFEDKLREIISAYNYLKSVKLC